MHYACLRPKGRIYIFEHNPFNPVTRWVVKHTAIDRNAVLLKPAEVRTGLHAAGAITVANLFSYVLSATLDLLPSLGKTVKLVSMRRTIRSCR